MPGLVDLVDLISLDVTRGLVQQGLGLGFDGRRFTRVGSPAALAITNATNATPIVLTCDRPHGIPATTKDGYPNALHAVVAGVLGNTAANAVDTDRKSRTVGINLGVQLTPVSATQFSMAAVNPTTGLVEPLAGNGNYISGGTITPALTEGRILMGREHMRFENSAPPYLAVTPVASEFDAEWSAHGAVGMPAELRNQKLYRPLAAETVVFQLHAWGQASPPNPRADFDMTQRLYQQVIQSIHLLMPKAYALRGGIWDDQRERATQLVKAGHYYVMNFALATPVLEFAMPFVPPPIFLDPHVVLQPTDGSAPEVGFSSTE